MRLVQFILLCTILLSCSHKQKGGFNAEYNINLKADSCFYFCTGISKLSLILKDNGTYFFTPHTNILQGYEGKWETEDKGLDGDVHIFTFNCNNGEIIKRKCFILNVKLNGKDCCLNFMDDGFSCNSGLVN